MVRAQVCRSLDACRHPTHAAPSGDVHTLLSKQTNIRSPHPSPIPAPCPLPMRISANCIAPHRAGSSSAPHPQAVATETKKLDRASVPLELEEGELPLNTFSPKKPFKVRLPRSHYGCRWQVTVTICRLNSKQ